MPQLQQQSLGRGGANAKSLAHTTSSSNSDPQQQTCSTSAASTSQAADLLCSDPAVLAYVRTLDEHRKKCELSGRYSEAAAAAGRIKDLQAKEGQRLTGLLAVLHQRELGQLQEKFQQESQAFDSKWRSRVSEYEASVATQLCALKQQHEAQITELLVRCEGERPQRPQHSSGILNGRKIEEALVKQGEYRRAREVKLSTDALYETELAATHQGYELVVELKRSKLSAKQQGEFDAFLSRAARGRNELELSRRDEADKRQNRFRALVQAVDDLHRLEALQLQAHLDSTQSLATPYQPLRDTNLRRKRELLGLQRA